MSHIKKMFGCLLFAGFLALQITATVSKTSLYPFDAYRMFSRNWNDGIVMERPAYEIEGVRHHVWDHLSLPFFQINALFYADFFDPAPAGAEDALCRQLQRTAGTTARIDVYREDVRYTRTEAQGMQAVILNREVVHVCR